MNDKNSFEQIIADFPRQLGYDGLALSGLETLGKHSYDGVVFLGMGGSALAAEIVRSVKDEIGLSLPVLIWKDYGLPPDAAHLRHPLYIAVSFSGNTAEPLSGVKQLLKAGSSKHAIAAVTSGGELLTIALRRDIPLVRFEAGNLQPRQGGGFMFYSIAALLHAARLIPRPVPGHSHLSAKQFRTQGMRLARDARNRLIIIYTQETSRFIGYLWKIRCNETAKSVAFNNTIPEMNHNEMVGFEGKQFSVAAIFLEEKNWGKALARQAAITRTLLADYRVKSIRVPLQGKTLLERTWNAIMCADWLAYFLALEHGTNPRELKILNKLKKELGK